MALVFVYPADARPERYRMFSDEEKEPKKQKE